MKWLKALTLKELREGAIGIAIMAAALALALAWALYMLRFNSQRREWIDVSIMGQTFQTMTVLAPAIGAAIFGFLSFFFESRKDLWAFLVHRPVSRSQLFWAKAGVGVAAYLLVLFIVFLLAAVWAAVPSNLMAPFEPRMLLPGTADLIASVAYYFAGAVVAMRQARWWGSRLMILAVPVIGSMLVVFLPEFGYAMLAAGVAIGITALAAWGQFIRGGYYQAQPGVARAALGFGTVVGLVFAGGIAVALALSFAEAPQNNGGVQRQYYVMRDGQIIQSVYENGQSRITDLQGKLVASLGSDVWTTRMQEQLAPSGGLIGPGSYMQTAAGYRDSARCVAIAAGPYGRMYYTVRDRGAVVVFDYKSRTLIGAIGADGLAPGRIWTDKPLDFAAGRVSALDMLATKHAIYRMDYAANKPSVRRTFPDETIIDIGYTRWANERDGRTPNLLVGTDKAIYMMDPDGHILLTYPHPLARHYTYAVGKLDEPGRFYVQQNADYTVPTSMLTTIQIVTADGQVLRENKLLRNTYPGNPTPMWQAGLGVIAPPAFVPLVVAIEAIEAAAQERPMFPKGTLGPWEMTAVACMVAGGLVSAVALWFLTGRYAFGRARRLAWVAVGLAFGAAGVVLFYCLPELPAKVVCPSCGRRRVASRDRCERCGAGWGTPARKGTEVFEGGAAIAQ